MRKDGVLRVLWVGRMLRLKRVGDIRHIEIAEWSAEAAARRLLAMVV